MPFLFLPCLSVYMLFGNLSCFAFCLAYAFFALLIVKCLYIALLVLMVFLCLLFFACVVFCCFLLCSLFFLLFFVFCVFVCDCFCALFGQCRTPETAPRGKHSRTAARGTPPPGLSCLPFCLCYRCILYYYARTYAAGGISSCARGYFFGMVCGKKSAKSVLLILTLSCSRSKTTTCIIPQLSCSNKQFHSVHT